MCSRHWNNKKLKKSDFLKLTLDKRSLHNRKEDEGDYFIQKTKTVYRTFPAYSGGPADRFCGGACHRPDPYELYRLGRAGQQQ